MKRRSNLRTALAGGRPVVGTFIKSADPAVAELFAIAGYDLLVADVEHASLALRDVEAIARAADVHGVPVLARIAPREAAGAGRFLDAGVSGIQLTDVSDEETLAALYRATRFPPQGRRSLALSHRAAGFGALSLDTFLERANDELLTVVQIESRTGAAAIEALLRSPFSPDVWFIGPLDLSSDLGHPGALSHPDVTRTIDHVLAAVHDHGACSGMFARDPEDAQRWLARGVSLILLGSDLTLLAAAARDSLAAIRV
jgi:2-keto-3-deoxy-L-rhamnonate aldolase RhmA